MGMVVEIVEMVTDWKVMMKKIQPSEAINQFNRACLAQQDERSTNSIGLTLIELLIVLVIIAIFILASIFAYQKQLAKGRDAKRKADLDKMQNVLEDYLNDSLRYPHPDELSSEGIICDEDFSPYLSQVPCDPINNDDYHYYYQTDEKREWYKIYANLENENDPAIVETGCEGGCGPERDYDYWVGSSNVFVCKDPYELPANGVSCDAGTPLGCMGIFVCLPSGDCCADPALTPTP